MKPYKSLQIIGLDIDIWNHATQIIKEELSL